MINRFTNPGSRNVPSGLRGSEYGGPVDFMSELEDARRRFTDARDEFKQVIKDLPSGLPHPDGAMGIQHASRVVHWAEANG